MNLVFPKHFEFGTSTAAYQIETGVEHDWCGVRARDGHVFGCTTDHEQRYAEDVDIIASLAPNYRMSLMWSRLQPAPLAPFATEATSEYHELLRMLKSKGVTIMMVLHHFAAPAEALAQLDDDRSLLRRLGLQAREQALRNFDERIVIQKTIDVYGELLCMPSAEMAANHAVTP